MPDDQMQSHVLTTVRNIWGLALLLMIGQLTITIILIFSRDTQFTQTQIETHRIVYYANLVTFLLFTPFSFYIRNQTFKRGWEKDAVKPQYYRNGTLFSIGIMTGVTLYSISAIKRTDHVFPNIILPLLSIIVLILLYPNGKAMIPTQNPYSKQP